MRARSARQSHLCELNLVTTYKNDPSGGNVNRRQFAKLARNWAGATTTRLCNISPTQPKGNISPTKPKSNTSPTQHFAYLHFAYTANRQHFAYRAPLLFLRNWAFTVLTFVEVLKNLAVAKKLGEIELPKDDAKKYEIWLNCCNWPFILVKEELCKDYAIENDVKKYFGENLVNFEEVLNTDFSPHNVKLSRKLNKFSKMEIGYANLNITKIVEWNLLEYDLNKIGNNDQKWDEIDQLRGECQKAYSNYYYSEKNANEKSKFEELMKNLIKVLRGI
uniref:Uncharacterized protein n=1 Tax=Globodera rostochiensis TaxID=31243 RepID=A0A914HLC3_GLORO